jgi:hopanoid-associated phosphorylase
MVGCAGGRTERAQCLAARFGDEGCEALISIGIAGGLSPELPSGTVVLGRKVRSVHGLLHANDALCDSLAARLPGAVQGVIAASDGIIDSPVAKRSLHHSYGALAVDMESFGLARTALDLGIPFAVIRIIADPAQRALPPAALVGMDEEGKVRPLRVLRSLISNPLQIPALIRVALDTQIALSALAVVVKRLI